MIIRVFIYGNPLFVDSSSWCLFIYTTLHTESFCRINKPIKLSVMKEIIIAFVIVAMSLPCC
jgi:hypothetical protein